MLNDHQIMESGIIEPYQHDLLNPHSYDCTLHPIIKLAVWQDLTRQWVEMKPNQLILFPGDFALGSTVEVITLPSDVVGFVQGKSSIGRTGLQVENAGLLDAGFSGTITLELYNMAPWPIELKPGMRICQLHFTRSESSIHKDYRIIGRYNGQRGPTEPRPEKSGDVRKNCILDCDSPSFPPGDDERLQCGCQSCMNDLKHVQTKPIIHLWKAKSSG
jgi:dCTP deaminase